MSHDSGGNIMKNKFIGAIILIFLTGAFLFPREKSIKIGGCTWYTGESSFDNILKIAKKKARPVLAFYSASWCGPCQRMKKNTLSKKEFRKIEKEAVLLFIEYTEKGGKRYTEKHKVTKFPTIKLFSSSGIELDTVQPDKKTQGILQWVKQVKEKDKLIKRLKRNPADWDALFKVTVERKKPLYSSDQYEPTIDLLRNALEAAGNKDKSHRQRARERLAYFLYLTMQAKLAPRAQKYAIKHKDEFTRIIHFYYPDEFRYILKKENPLVMWINWLTTAGDHRGAVDVFENLPPRMRKNLETGKNMNLLEGIIKSFLSLGQEKKVEMWANRIETAYQKDMKKRHLEEPPLIYIRILANIIEYQYDKRKESDKKRYINKLLGVISATEKKFAGNTLYKSFTDFENIIQFFHDRNMKDEVNKIAAILKKMINSFEDESCRTFTTIRLAKRYGVFVDEALKLLSETKRGMYPGIDTYRNINRAVLLAKKGEREKAMQIINRMYEKINNSRDTNKMSLSITLNKLAWATFEMGAVNDKSLDMAEKSVRLNRGCSNLDTLATIHAVLGNFKKAVKIGRQARDLANGEKEQVIIEEKLARWQEKVE